MVLLLSFKKNESENVRVHERLSALTKNVCDFDHVLNPKYTLRVKSATSSPICLGQSRKSCILESTTMILVALIIDKIAPQFSP